MADVVEEDTEIVQVLEVAEVDMEDQGQLNPRLLLQQEMNKQIAKNFCILRLSLYDFLLAFGGTFIAI